MNKKMPDPQSSKISWNPDKEYIVERYIQALMDILTINVSGRAETTKGMELHAYLHILLNILDFSDIGGSNYYDVRWGLLYKTVYKLKLCEKQTLGTFRDLLSSEVYQYLALPEEKYIIVYPLHIADGELNDFRSFTVMETKMYISNWTRIQRRFDIDSFMEKVDRFFPENNFQLISNFTPIIVVSKGRDEKEAFDFVDRKIELFRFHLNMLDEIYRYHFQFGGYPKPYGKILPSPVYGIFGEDGKFDEIFYNLAIYPGFQKNKLNTKQFKNARKMVGNLRDTNDDNDCAKLFIEAVENAYSGENVH